MGCWWQPLTSICAVLRASRCCKATLAAFLRHAVMCHTPMLCLHLTSLAADDPGRHPAAAAGPQGSPAGGGCCESAGEWVDNGCSVFLAYVAWPLQHKAPDLHSHAGSPTLLFSPTLLNLSAHPLLRQELAPGVLSRLTALTTPTTLCLTDASQEDLTEAGSSGMGGSEGAASSIRAKAGPVLALPRLVMLSAHPPPARLHSGISRQQAGTASAAVGSRGAEGQGQDQVHKQPLSGAERRRQRMPQVRACVRACEWG